MILAVVRGIVVNRRCRRRDRSRPFLKSSTQYLPEQDVTRDFRKTRPATPRGHVDVIVPRVGEYLWKQLKSLLNQARKPPRGVSLHPARWQLAARIKVGQFRADLFWQMTRGPVEKLATMTVIRNAGQGQAVPAVSIDPLDLAVVRIEAGDEAETSADGVGLEILNRLKPVLYRALEPRRRVSLAPNRWGLSAQVENGQLQADLFWQTIAGPVDKLATVTVTRNRNRGRPILEVAIDPLHFSGAGTDKEAREEAIEHCVSWAWLTFQGEDRRRQP